MNVVIWVTGTVNQPFIAGFYTQIKFPKNKVINGKTPFFVIHFVLSV